VAFAGSLNRSTSHSLDWQRFYDFIIGEAVSRSAAGVSEVGAFLVEQGLLREEARLWALRYDFGLGLLRRFRDVPR
jgi:hypothetical protein